MPFIRIEVPRIEVKDGELNANRSISWRVGFPVVPRPGENIYLKSVNVDLPVSEVEYEIDGYTSAVVVRCDVISHDFDNIEEELRQVGFC